MKKLTAFFLMILMCLSFAACGEKTEPVSVEFYMNGEVSVFKAVAEKNKNGDIICTVDYTAPAGRNIAVFNPPDGDLFKYMPTETTKADKNSLKFTIESKNATAVKELTINFYLEGNEEDYILLKFD